MTQKRGMGRFPTRLGVIGNVKEESKCFESSGLWKSGWEDDYRTAANLHPVNLKLPSKHNY
jgi:hypothetical protein